MHVPAIYNKYRVDSEKETRGVQKDCGDFVVTLARAGGGNEAYATCMAELFAPYEQVMALDEMPEEKARECWYKALARTVIKGWQFRDVDPKTGTKYLVDGLGRDEEGNVVPVTEENLVALFTSAHELFVELKVFAERRENYLIANLQAAAKN